MSKQYAQGALAGVVRGEEFISEFAAQIHAVENDGRPVSVAVVDIDEFGKINQEYGNETGDAVLAHTIEFLKGIAQQGGATIHRVIFRCGGDEFAIILPGVQKEEAFLTMERGRAEFAANPSIRSDGKAVEVTISAAIATYPEDGTRPQDVLRKAVDAIYRAKTTGRNKVCLAKEERMVTKTSHYTQPQLARLTQLSKRENVGEAVLLREALDDVLAKYDS